MIYDAAVYHASSQPDEVGCVGSSARRGAVEGD